MVRQLHRDLPVISVPVQRQIPHRHTPTTATVTATQLLHIMAAALMVQARRHQAEASREAAQEVSQVDALVEVVVEATSEEEDNRTFKEMKII